MSRGRQPVARKQVRRLPEKASHDRQVLDRLLAQSLVAHVAVTDDDGQPYVVPMAFAPDGDRVLLHGSSASRLTRTLAAGAPTCVTVTALDAVVLARSQFESSMSYRSAMLLGRCAQLGSRTEGRTTPRTTSRGRCGLESFRCNGSGVCQRRHPTSTTPTPCRTTCWPGPTDEDDRDH